MPTNIDPVEFGKLIADMESMKSTLSEMKQEMKVITELANQWRGALWFAGIAGGILSSLGTLFVTKFTWLAAIFR